MATYAQTDNAIRSSAMSPAAKQLAMDILPGGGSKQARRTREFLIQRAFAHPVIRPRLPRQCAVRMARRAWDEHGGFQDSYVCQLDYLPPEKTKAAPYFDIGGAGLGLVSATATTRYRGAFKGYSSSCSEAFLIGRNEVGSWFAHRVPTSCGSVAGAIDWIWGGRADRVVRRQGDIAVIVGKGPKGLDKLPGGHTVDGDTITHATHPTISCPGTGECVIVGRRAAQKGHGAGANTKD